MDEQALGQVLDAQVRRHGESDDADEFRCMCTDDRTPEDHSGGRVRDELHEASGVAFDHRFGVDGEGDLGDADLLSVREGLGLGKSDIGNLGLGEDGRSSLVVIEMAVDVGCGGPSRAPRSSGPGQMPPTRAEAGQRDRPRRRCAPRLTGNGGSRRRIRSGRPSRRPRRARDQPSSGPTRSRASACDASMTRPSSQDTTTPSPLRTSAVRPCADHQLHPTREEVGLERCRHFRILPGQNLLTRDDQGDPAAERAEHVDELDTGHPGADDDDMLGDRPRRVGLASDQDPVTVDLGPVGKPRRRAGGDENRIGLEILADFPVRALRDDADRVRSEELAGAADHAYSLTFQLSGHRRSERVGDAFDALAKCSEVRIAGA